MPPGIFHSGGAISHPKSDVLILTYKPNTISVSVSKSSATRVIMCVRTCTTLGRITLSSANMYMNGIDSLARKCAQEFECNWSRSPDQPFTPVFLQSVITNSRLNTHFLRAHYTHFCCGVYAKENSMRRPGESPNDLARRLEHNLCKTRKITGHFRRKSSAGFCCLPRPGCLYHHDEFRRVPISFR